jgi:hypothetical protein
MHWEIILEKIVNIVTYDVVDDKEHIFEVDPLRIKEARVKYNIF